MYITKNNSILTKDRFVLLTEVISIIHTFKRLATKEKALLSHYRLPPPQKTEQIRQLINNILQSRPHLIILGLASEKANLDLCKYIKKQRMFSYIPVLVMSCSNYKPKNVINILKAGADDCLIKTIDKELLAVRIRAILRRTTFRIEQEETYTHKELVLNATTHIVTVKERPINLTPKEFDLLYFLMKNKGKVMSRKELLEMVWELNWYGDPRTLNKHIETLRRKLGKPANTYIKTVERIGYKFE